MANEDLERIVRYEADTSQAISQLDKLTEATQRNAEQMDKMGGQLASIGTKLDIAGAFYIAREVIEEVSAAIKNMIDSMDQLGKSAQQVGLSVEKVQQLQYALGFAGLKSSETVTVLGRLTDKLADIDDMTNKSSRSLRAMGIAAGDDASTAILKMADAFKEMDDGTEQTSLAVDTFGRTLGMKMIPALNDGSDAVARLMAEQSQYGTVSEESARQASEFNDKLTRLGEVFLALGKAIVAEALPALNKFLDWCLSMVGPVSKAITWLDQLNSKFSAGALAAKQFSIAAQSTLPESWKGMAGSVDAFVESERKAAAANEDPQWLKKAGDQARATAEAFAQLPAKIKKLREDMSYLDPTVEKDALLLKSYTKQLEALEKQLDGTTQKARGAKTPAVQSSDFERWMDSMLKFATASDDAGDKIDWLQRHLDALTASGDTSSIAFQKWTAELRKLQPDPAADALERIAKAAKDLEASPAVIAGIAQRLTDLIAASKGASEEARLLRDEYLKLTAAKDPIAAVTAEILKMNDAMKQSDAMQAAWFQALASGDATAEQFAAGINKWLPQVNKGLDNTRDKAKSLGDAIGEAGARFVGDFADQLIENMGRVDQSFSDLIDSMLRQLAKLAINQQFANLFKAVDSAGGWGNFLGGLGGAAQGAAWSGRGVDYMASGGILNHPMLFANGGRLAVAGEAGPEAVVPLQRGASGNLGVAASPVNVQVNNYSDATVTTTSRDNVDGSRTIELEIRRQVRSALSDGSMDRTMRSSYGLTRQPAIG